VLMSSGGVLYAFRLPEAPAAPDTKPAGGM
jgi:hypothetical protein